MLPLVQRLSLLRDGVLVPLVLDLQAVQLRGQRYHAQAVPVCPQRHRKKDNLRQQRENHDGQPIAAAQRIAPTDDIPQGDS